jgi:predicted AAA+ superfamily ATPase
MKRSIETALNEWKQKTGRLILLLRGARQVGKTYSVRMLGRSFPHFLEINFEAQTHAKVFFDGDINCAEVCERLAAYAGVPVIPGKTLLFFDEVQACPACLRALRFFHEQMPELHVVAAGSLLEFALAEIPSFGVGRIASLFMYPMSFMEFLRAEGSAMLADYIEKNGLEKPLDAPLHTKLLEKLRICTILGGMPAVIENYCTTHDLLVCQEILDHLLTSLFDDFAKYNTRVSPRILRDTMRSVSRQAGGKFMYTAVGEEFSIREIKSALENLEMAGLIYRVCHTAGRGVPLGAEINDRRFKIIPFDIGLHQRLCGLSLAEYLTMGHEELVNKGSIAEVFAGIELITSNALFKRPELYYWHREKHDSNAEVDYVIQKGMKIFPVEVKSGTKGSMQSMRIFLEERSLSRGIRLSQENCANYENISAVPVYMAGMILKSESVIAP